MDWVRSYEGEINDIVREKFIFSLYAPLIRQIKLPAFEGNMSNPTDWANYNKKYKKIIQEFKVQSIIIDQPINSLKRWCYENLGPQFLQYRENRLGYVPLAKWYQPSIGSDRRIFFANQNDVLKAKLHVPGLKYEPEY